MPANNKEYAKEYNKQYYRKNKEKWDKKRDSRTKYKKRHRDALNAYQLEYAKKTNYRHSKAIRERRLSLVNQIKDHYGCLKPNCKWSGELMPCCLDFHHLDNDNKTYVSQMLKNSDSKVSEEINKCTLLCAVCHRLATYNELDCSDFVRCSVSDKLEILAIA